MKTLLDRPVIRVAALLVILLAAYLGVYLGARVIANSDRHYFLGILGVGVACILMAAYLTTHIWLRFVARKLENTSFQHYARADAILQELADRAGFDIELRVMHAERLFIYSAGLSNRLVLISTGALENLSEEAMRGVLAHEVAHMVLSHAAKNASAFAAFFGLRIALEFPKGVGLFMVFWLLLYLRHREYEADKIAALMVGRAPVIQALKEVKQLTRAKEFGKLMEFLISTHPSYERREAALHALEHHH